MQFCQKHWDELKDAIKTRGLFNLVAKSGEIACENLADEIEGNGGKKTFDPLMWAHNSILAFALQNMGLELMIGDKCPLCELRGPPPSNWINGAADDVLKCAREFGLAAEVQ